jgi:hypothetical protein
LLERRKPARVRSSAAANPPLSVTSAASSGTSRGEKAQFIAVTVVVQGGHGRFAAAPALRRASSAFARASCAPSTTGARLSSRPAGRCVSSDDLLLAWGTPAGARGNVNRSGEIHRGKRHSRSV